METNKSGNSGGKNGDGINVIQNDEGKYLSGKEAADCINIYYAEMGKLSDTTSNNWKEGSMNMDGKSQEFVYLIVLFIR